VSVPPIISKIVDLLDRTDANDRGTVRRLFEGWPSEKLFLTAEGIEALPLTEPQKAYAAFLQIDRVSGAALAQHSHHDSLGQIFQSAAATHLLVSNPWWASDAVAGLTLALAGNPLPRTFYKSEYALDVAEVSNGVITGTMARGASTYEFRVDFSDGVNGSCEINGAKEFDLELMPPSFFAQLHRGVLAHLPSTTDDEELARLRTAKLGAGQVSATEELAKRIATIELSHRTLFTRAAELVGGDTAVHAVGPAAQADINALARTVEKVPSEFATAVTNLASCTAADRQRVREHLSGWPAEIFMTPEGIASLPFTEPQKAFVYYLQLARSQGDDGRAKDHSHLATLAEAFERAIPSSGPFWVSSVPGVKLVRYSHGMARLLEQGAYRIELGVITNHGVTGRVRFADSPATGLGSEGTSFELYGTSKSLAFNPSRKSLATSGEAFAWVDLPARFLEAVAEPLERNLPASAANEEVGRLRARALADKGIDPGVLAEVVGALRRAASQHQQLYADAERIMRGDKATNA
jgi:hypothetical protein